MSLMWSLLKLSTPMTFMRASYHDRHAIAVWYSANVDGFTPPGKYSSMTPSAENDSSVGSPRPRGSYAAIPPRGLPGVDTPSRQSVRSRTGAPATMVSPEVRRRVRNQDSAVGCQNIRIAYVGPLTSRTTAPDSSVSHAARANSRRRTDVATDTAGRGYRTRTSWRTPALHASSDDHTASAISLGSSPRYVSRSTPRMSSQRPSEMLAQCRVDHLPPHSRTAKNVRPLTRQQMSLPRLTVHLRGSPRALSAKATFSSTVITARPHGPCTSSATARSLGSGARGRRRRCGTFARGRQAGPRHRRSRRRGARARGRRRGRCRGGRRPWPRRTPRGPGGASTRGRGRG